MNPFPKLQTVQDSCTSYESAKKNMVDLSGQKINKVQQYEKRETVHNKYSKPDTQEKCSACGKNHDPSKFCRARNWLCKKCKTRGHYDSVCLNKAQ